MSSKRVILCSMVLAWICVSESQSSFFIAKKYGEENYFCVTNTSFAMSWNLEFTTERLQQNSVYVPESISTFNYDIKNDWYTQNYFIKHPWSLQSSANEIILDERWEEMEVIKTEPANLYNIPAKFIPLKLSSANFDVALSIRTKIEGHIFLCDGEKPSESNCYWIMLQAFGGAGSAIRKCKKGEVPDWGIVYPTEPCSIKRASVNHTEFPHYLNNSEWFHFILSKQDGRLTFSQHSDNKVLKILEWRDPEAPIDVTHMVLHSKFVNSLWKIHEIDFIAATIQSNEIELGRLLYAREGFVCISMYVSMCQFCKLKLSLRRQYSIISNMIYEPEHTGWNQIKFITENLSNDDTPMHLLVSTVSGDSNPYWFIDKIRFCRPKEFRKISLTDQANCQLMSGKGKIITFLKQPALSGDNCPEDTIGPFCVKCNLIFDNCRRTTTYTKERCVCSAGCYGPKCDISPSIMFANPPTVTDITTDGATISVSDFEIANRERNQEPLEYLVQYKEAKAVNSIWISHNMTFRFNVPSKFKIKNLNEETRYLVRSVIVTATGQPQMGEGLKYIAFTTMCQDLEKMPKFFNVTSSDKAALLRFSHIDSENVTSQLAVCSARCISKSCTSQEERIQVSYIHSDVARSLIKLDELAPFSEYQVELEYPQIRCHIFDRRTFKTKPTVPGKVQNLLVYTKNETSISLRWQPPAPPTGNLNKYKIVYSYIARFYQSQEVSVQPVQCKLWPDFHCATLSDLVEDIYYRIEVSARNEDPADFGPSQETATLTETEKSRAPYDLKVNWSQQNDLLLEWKHPNQTNGDIQYFNITISLGKQQTSTKKLNITDGMYNLTYFYQINATEFTPTRTYTVSVFAFNDQAGYKRSESTMSPPDIPTLSSDPEFEGTNDTIQVTLSLNKPQGANKNYRLIVLRTEYDAKSIESLQELKNYDLQNLRLVLDCDISVSSPHKLVLGDDQETKMCSKNENPPLKPATEYNITIILINTYNDYRRDRIYSYSYRTLGVPPDMPTLKELPIPHVFNRTIRIPIFLNDLQGKTDSYRIIILRSDKETNVHSYKELDEFDLGNLRVVIDCNFTNINNPLFVILGHPQPSAICQDFNNSLLEPATPYNVTIILMNTFHGAIRTNIYSLEIKAGSESNLTLFALFPLLLVIPAAGTFYYYKKRKAAETKNRDVQGFIKDEILSNGEVKTDNMMLKKKNTFNKNTANIDEIPKGDLKLVTVKNFSNYFKTSLENQELKNQYGTILETNLMYETVMGDSLRSEYLDMNFNSGLQIKNAYFITKFPAIAEFNEFWKIIIDESVDHIVLFAHLHPDQKKTKNYWPEVGKSLRCGDVIIECNMCQKYTFYIRRKFSLKCKNKIRKVDQLHLCLPQNDRRYLSSLNYVQFFLELLKIPLCSRTPILVHSSSGMRGNGFALLCDMSLRSAQKDRAIDVMAIFKTLVQTTPEMKIEFDHYVAAHAIIADTLNHLDTSVACNSFDCTKSELFTKSEIQKHLKYLKDTLWMDQIVIEEENECYVNCPTILLKDGRKDVQQEICSDHQSHSKQSDFIRVGGFKTPGKFWIAKQPLSTPFSDFLENVQERKISVIVTLNDNIFTWPNEDHPEMGIGNDVTLKYKFIKKMRVYDWITLELITKTTSEILDVVSFKKWPAPVVSLPKVDDFLNFVKESNEIFQNTEPVLVTCHDGRTSCGLYLATSYNVQQIKTENICDVCTCVRTIRRHCQHFTKDDEQYIFLVEAAHNYIKEFSLYEVR